MSIGVPKDSQLELVRGDGLMGSGTSAWTPVADPILAGDDTPRSARPYRELERIVIASSLGAT